MSINRKELTEIANLAKLDLNAEQTQQVCQSLNQITDMVERIKKADTAQVDPMFHPCDFWMPLRKDVVTEATHKEQLLALAKQADADFYLVPKVIE
ncbi:aspartyl/glutamyl-tRNA(Asn/Gln) amidotransferase subunit C [Marinicella pacifica]|uniref:Aspartyl/glutamyl-tRNA(Asn/Gln) amidotransferase subunit C n=1 Tax=Marinicella pacifica TaxID=1171543 RepID=A0A917FNL1_9GAMM|nr:Asp-tRNA(Asn)/Glu-tRNA(Gln) amidotransferase subunit GatC [Marinicella pacifica]GGF94427.1 aspartyl/glutamyl-tRNA(Asn/Gln) amidotransferase subunit C [Marinicella pacifica]